MSIKVWSRFSRTSKDGSVLKLRIQDLASDRHQEAIDFIKSHFIPDEALEKAAGISKSEEAMEEAQEIFKGLMSKPTVYPVICCFDIDSERPQIFGTSIIELTERKENEDPFKEIKAMIQAKETKKFFEFLEDIHTFSDVLEKYGYEKWYDGRGISVHPDYRGLGIGTEFVKQRRQMCNETGVPMTTAWMTSLGTQKAADRDGWETVAEVSFDDLEKRHGVVFETTAPTNKLMIARIC